MKRVAVVLSGCGFLDGSEIYEATFGLLALAQKNHLSQLFAPDKPQTAVVDHVTRQIMPEVRNVLVESGRIARGDIAPLKELQVVNFDALFLPGGFGVVTHLSDFITQQENCTVDPDLKRIVLEFHKEKKPILATCITPVILAKIFEGVAKITLTLGQDKSYDVLLHKLGMNICHCTVADCCLDKNNRVYTTPCFMEPPDLPKMFAALQELTTYV